MIIILDFFCFIGCSCERRRGMPKVVGNNRSSALKRLSNPYSTTKIDRRPAVVGTNTSTVNDARQILLNRNQTSFDARQLLSRQTSKNDANDDKMVVVTGLKDMKMKDGRVTTKSLRNSKKKHVFQFLARTNVNHR